MPIVFIGGFIYTLYKTFEVNIDFGLGLAAFWIGFYYDTRDNKTESNDTLAKVAYGICALCFVRGFWTK